MTVECYSLCYLLSCPHWYSRGAVFASGEAHKQAMCLKDAEAVLDKVRKAWMQSSMDKTVEGLTNAVPKAEEYVDLRDEPQAMTRGKKRTIASGVEQTAECFNCHRVGHWAKNCPYNRNS